MREPCCGYCGAPAVDTIPAMPQHVCRKHAELFWTGVLAEVAARRLESKGRLPDEEPAIVARVA
jgi:hypothetical protein